MKNTHVNFSTISASDEVAECAVTVSQVALQGLWPKATSCI